MKNWLYYILIYLLISSLFGVLGFFYSRGYLIYYVLTIIAFGGVSYLIDIFRIRRTLRNSVVYIERRFFCLDYKYYYKSLFYKILLTFLFLYLMDIIFNIESSIHAVLIFLSLFIVIYINMFPIFFVKIEKRVLQSYIETCGSNDIYIKAYNENEIHCLLRLSDLKRISVHI